MPTQVTIKNVSPGTPWSNDFGTFHPFTLTVDGIDQPVTVNRKPDSPALEVGQQLWLETKPGRNGLAGKIVQAPDQQQAMRTQPLGTLAPRSNGTPNHDDATRRSIERQTSMRAATDLYHGTGHDPVEVVRAADILYGWVSQ